MKSNTLIIISLFQETKEWFDRMKNERSSPGRLALTSQEERQRFFDETRERILQSTSSRLEGDPFGQFVREHQERFAALTASIMGDPQCPPERLNALTGAPPCPPERLTALTGAPPYPPERLSALTGGPNPLEVIGKPAENVPASTAETATQSAFSASATKESQPNSSQQSDECQQPTAADLVASILNGKTFNQTILVLLIKEKSSLFLAKYFERRIHTVDWLILASSPIRKQSSLLLLI